MQYNAKKVAELIANRNGKDLEKALQPRLMQIADIIASVKHGLDIKDTVGNDFAVYIRSGAYSNKEKFSFGYFADLNGRPGLSFSYSVSYEEDGAYPVDYDITMPVEFATCEDQDLKHVVLQQIYDDLYQHVEELDKKYREAYESRKKFIIKYHNFLVSD